MFGRVCGFTDRKDAALIAFVKRQTGIQSTSWLRDPGDADKAVEALKKWLQRAGVDWSVIKGNPDYMRQPGYKVSFAQCRILKPDFWYAKNLHEDVIWKFFPDKSNGQMTARDWVKVMNALGEQIRANAKLAEVR